jgi:hypothetical protein
VRPRRDEEGPSEHEYEYEHEQSRAGWQGGTYIRLKWPRIGHVGHEYLFAKILLPRCELVAPRNEAPRPRVGRFRVHRLRSRSGDGDEPGPFGDIIGWYLCRRNRIALPRSSPPKRVRAESRHQRCSVPEPEPNYHLHIGWYLASRRRLRASEPAESYKNREHGCTGSPVEQLADEDVGRSIPQAQHSLR